MVVFYCNKIKESYFRLDTIENGTPIKLILKRVDLLLYVNFIKKVMTVIIVGILNKFNYTFI